jgi:hypothetical protein
MKLPASLAPWAKHLQIFPEEISLTLGNFVQRIALFIRPLDSGAEDADGEPNGYDGVARRGIYERLLLSELALADDFGEEFIRRAAMGEHLFLHLSRILPGAKRISVALFDAGALQLGAPRIAHLATFIVLARRAEQAGAMFLWGVLQDAKQLVISDDTEASLKILLESRTAAAVNREDVSEWREKLREIDKMSDVWLIGSENLSQFEETKKFSHLYIEESLELEKRELFLKIKSASGTERTTVLELPPPNVCTRLLRNPFERIPKPDFTSIKLDRNVTNFFFDSTGAKLFVKLNSNDVWSFAVQNTQGSGKIYPTVYKSYDSKNFVAAGRLRKAIAFASKVDEQTIRLEYRKHGFILKEGLYRAASTNIAFPEDKNGLLQIYSVRPREFHYDEAAILDAKGNLFLLNQSRSEQKSSDAAVGTMTLLATRVLAVAQNDEAFVFVGCEDGNDFHRIVAISHNIERDTPPVTRAIKKAMFGRGEYGKKVIGFEDASGNWTIVGEDSKVRLMPLPKGEVVGVYHDARFAPNAGFFELMDDRRTLEFCWQHGRRKHILTADAEIVKIEFSPRSPVFAYQTANGELILYSLTHRAPIGRYSK